LKLITHYPEYCYLVTPSTVKMVFSVAICVVIMIVYLQFVKSYANNTVRLFLYRISCRLLALLWLAICTDQTSALMCRSTKCVACH